MSSARRRHLRAASPHQETPPEIEHASDAPKVAHADPGERELAQRIEAVFLGYGRTLVDADDAEGYEITMALVLVMLDGARARGVINAAQHAELSATYEGMKRAPRHL